MNIIQRKLAYSNFVDVVETYEPRDRRLRTVCRVAYYGVLCVALVLVVLHLANGATHNYFNYPTELWKSAVPDSRSALP